MTDTTQVRPRFGRFDDHDENSEDGRPTYGDEGIVFDGDDVSVDEDRLSSASAGRLLRAGGAGIVLALVSLFAREPGRWATVRYIVSERAGAR